MRGDKAYSSRAIRGHLRPRDRKTVLPEPDDRKGQRKRRGPGVTGPHTSAHRWDSGEYRIDRRELIEDLLDPSAPAELRGADLAGVALKSTEVPELWNAWVYGARLDRVDFRFAYLASTFDEATILACDFTRATIERTTMMRTRSADTLFVQTKLRHVLMNNAGFEQCTFTEAHFDGGLSGTSTRGGRGVVFQSCEFTGTRFTGQEWRQAQFLDCQFQDVVVTKSDFGAAKFSRCLFQAGSWDPASISRATFDGDSPRRAGS